MAGWSITAATYLAFRDDVLRTLIARQAQQQFGYEDRIAELRAQIDRTTSRQLLDQEQFEQKLDEVTRRQATLESRAAALGNLADPAVTGSIGNAALRRPGPSRDRHATIAAGNPASARRSTAWKLRSIASIGGNPWCLARWRTTTKSSREPHPQRARSTRDEGRRGCAYRRTFRPRQAAVRRVTDFRARCSGSIWRDPKWPSSTIRCAPCPCASR